MSHPNDFLLAAPKALEMELDARCLCCSSTNLGRTFLSYTLGELVTQRLSTFFFVSFFK